MRRPLIFFVRIVIFLSVALWANGQTTPGPLQPGTPLQQIPAYVPMTAADRLHWTVTKTIGWESLSAGLISAAWATGLDTPKEYGPHWSGYGKRYGMRLTGVSTGNVMEAGLGAIWGEDPRYFRTHDRPFKQRVGNIVAMTFMARNRDGRLMPAYARYAAISGNNFLSNTWRPDSDTGAGDAVRRTMYGVLGRMAGNAFDEFWPDVKRLAFHKKTNN